MSRFSMLLSMSQARSMATCSPLFRTQIGLDRLAAAAAFDPIRNSFCGSDLGQQEEREDDRDSAKAGVRAEWSNHLGNSSGSGFVEALCMCREGIREFPEKFEFEGETYLDEYAT